MANQPFATGLLRTVGGPPNGLQSPLDFGPFRRPTRRSTHSHSLPAFHRHGSGAGSDPMDTGFQRRRARTPSPGRRDHQPGGPVTASEWSDQIEWLQRQLTVLNRTVNDHAHLIGKMKTELETTIPAIIQRVSNLETSVNKRFEDGSIAINRKIDTIQAELRSFAAHMQSPPKPPEHPPGMGHHTAENFNVASPTERRPADNPYAMPGVDIWQNLGPGHVPTGEEDVGGDEQ